MLPSSYKASVGSECAVTVSVGCFRVIFFEADQGYALMQYFIDCCG